MNWGWFVLWAVGIIVLFFVTGWVVQPALGNVWGNHYDQKDLTYYSLLYFHYLMGGLFFSFLGLGVFRNLIWPPSKIQGSNRQLTFLLAYSMLIASVIAIVLAHKYSPVEEMASNMPTTAPVSDDVNGRQLELEQQQQEMASQPEVHQDIIADESKP
jgi:hypothetical protein